MSGEAAGVVAAAGLTAAPDRALGSVVWKYAPVVLSAVLVVFFQLPFLREPMETDEAIYFVVASSGDLPYVDAFDHKPPVIFFIFKLALFLNSGEPSPETVRLMAAAMLTLTAIGVYLTGKAMRDHTFGAIAALAFSAFTANQYLQLGGNTEAFALPALAFSLFAFVLALKTGRLGWFALAGALGAVATLTKTSMAVSLLAYLPILALAGSRRKISWSAATKACIAMGLPAGAVVVFAALPWVLSGHLDELWYANVTSNIRYSEGVDFYLRPLLAFAHGFRVIWGALPLWVLCVAGAFTSILPRRETLTLRILVVGALVGISWTGLFYPHYFVQLLPGAALLVAAAVLEITSRWGRARSRVSTLAAIVPLTLVAALGLSRLYVGDSEARLEARWGKEHAGRIVASQPVAGRIAQLTDDRDRIYVLGVWPQLYTVSGRRPAARIFVSSHLELGRGALDETLPQLRADRTRLVVDTALRSWPDGKMTDDLDEETRARFDSILAADYRLVETARYGLRIVSFYERKD